MADLGMMTIPIQEYLALKEADDTLNALYGAGIDNCEAYQEAMAQLDEDDD